MSVEVNMSPVLTAHILLIYLRKFDSTVINCSAGNGKHEFQISEQSVTDYVIKPQCRAKTVNSKLCALGANGKAEGVKFTIVFTPYR